MKWCSRSIALLSVFGFLFACGGEGAQGPPGEDAEVETEAFEEHDDCPGSGIEILVDGEVTAVVCDGISSDVTTQRNDDHDECPAGGLDIIVDGEVVDVVCDGEDGEDGEGQAPEISIDEDPEECGDAGGVAVTIGDEDPFQICNGESSDAPDITIGDDEDCGEAGGYSITVGDADPVDICNGEDGFTPTVETEELDPDPTGPCVDGGVRLTITSQDADGDPAEESVVICAGNKPLPDPEIGWCNVAYPDSIEQYDDEATTVYGHVEVDGYTGEQGGQLPEEFAGQLGWGDAGVDPSDSDWEWLDADVDEDFDWDDSRDSFMADLGPVDAGEYHYLYRMTVDGQEWTYCGLEGIVDLEDFDGEVDPGFLDVSTAPTVIGLWDFDAEDEADRLLNPPIGDGWARFSDGTEEDPVGGSTFFGSTHWVGQGYWSEDSEFPDEEFEDREFFEFNSDDFSDFDEVLVNVDFQRTTTGPAQAQMVAEFDDGTLAMLEEAVELPDGSSSYNLDISPDVLEVFEGELEDGDEVVSYRVYGFDSGNFGGSENMRIEDIEFIGF